ncbi:hypothetical protein DL766_007357 [Monosporascus sp. MC13-8B]|uniref:RNase H type-1 domain-containing protein n=1 Tax=Monosporascus cannonballus TaxID=155416 RepID=A0ABY0H570_9PEZI|nr:hypothetical protein DL762_005312 [Monosporascus cannonballus]RYO88433.1 hypothetical protein DL763_006013 [Monosporascus cannonballus]RYP24148.1 hypothetical protein DL766_007357 [Monosporascus sp. MC13-8B]
MKGAESGHMGCNSQFQVTEDLVKSANCLRNSFTPQRRQNALHSQLENQSSSAILSSAKAAPLTPQTPAEDVVQKYRNRSSKAKDLTFAGFDFAFILQPINDGCLGRSRNYVWFPVLPSRQVAITFNSTALDEMEIIQPFTLAPWQARMPVNVDNTEEMTPRKAIGDCSVHVAVSSSSRNGVVGVGGAIRFPRLSCDTPATETFSFTLGWRTEQNPYSGELAAMAYAMRKALAETHSREIVVHTSNKAAALAIHHPLQQSGQAYIRSIYESVETLRARENTAVIQWLPSSSENELLRKAKEEARKTTKEDAVPQKQFPAMRSTTTNMARSEQRITSIPDKIGRHSKRVDVALPGKHTKKIYDQLGRREASVLVQLRTDKARLNEYLYHIHAAPSDLCSCGRARETVEHFLFTCSKWTEQRKAMLECTTTKRGNLPYHLGGKR